MIFNLFPRVVIKLGDERYVFDQSTLMFPEVAEVERVTGLSYGEWVQQLHRYYITAIAALVHVLRKRAGVPSDFATLNFAAADLDVVPLHDDDSEFTAEEVVAELARRLAQPQQNGAGPTLAADAPEAPSGEDGSTPRQPTSPSSPPATTSGPGSGKGSRTRTGSSSKRTRTPS